jgi:hypothetical protein
MDYLSISSTPTLFFFCFVFGRGEEKWLDSSSEKRKSLFTLIKAKKGYFGVNGFFL